MGRIRSNVRHLDEQTITGATVNVHLLSPSRGYTFVHTAVGRGVPVAVATNNIDWLLEFLLTDLTGLKTVIPDNRIVTSTKAGCRKRDPKFWGYLRNALAPDFLPDRTVFIDDRQIILTPRPRLGFGSCPASQTGRRRWTRLSGCDVFCLHGAALVCPAGRARFARLRGLACAWSGIFDMGGASPERECS